MELLESQLMRKYHAVKMDKIVYGWSSDEKYHMTDENGKQYLVRFSKKESLEAKKKEFRIIQKMNTLDVTMSQAVEVGYSEELDKTYMVFTWVEGEMLSQCILNMSEEKQYLLGKEAGEMLKKIHEIPVDLIDLPQNSLADKKMRQLKAYTECLSRVEKDEYAISYIMENVDLLKQEKIVYKHGDFHMGNFIFMPNGKIGLVDFNRLACGEAYEEFQKIQLFEVEVSIPFAIGKLKGYFRGEIPKEFWQLQKWYVAHSSLFSIKWAEQFGQKDVDGMIERYHMAAKDYDDFQLLIPKWYSNNEKKFLHL